MSPLSPSRVVALLFARRVAGPAAWAIAALRVAAGVIFASFSLGKFRRHEAEVGAFEEYGIPIADVMVYVVGTLELVAGALLIMGLLTRPAALAMAGNMVVALATAGRIEPSFVHTALPPLLIVVMALLLWGGPGRLGADGRLEPAAAGWAYRSGRAGPPA